MKFSKTGYESGASDLGAIVEVEGKFLMPFGLTPNDIIDRHKNALAGIEQRSTRVMEGGNRYEQTNREWFEDDFQVKVDCPKQGYRNKTCNLVASLDGEINEEFKIIDYNSIEHFLKPKTVIDFKFPRTAPKNPEDMSYLLQVQGQMDSADADNAIVAYLSRDKLEWTIVVTQRHEPTIKAIHQAVDTFWQHMKNGTMYECVTSSEASKYIPGYGNNAIEPHDLRNNSNNIFSDNDREKLILLSDRWKLAKSQKKEAENTLEETSLEMKKILGGVEQVLLPDTKVSHKTVEYKAQPEKTKIIPAKKSHTQRRFSCD
jgi:hypothetical protein